MKKRTSRTACDRLQDRSSRQVTRGWWGPRKQQLRSQQPPRQRQGPPADYTAPTRSTRRQLSAAPCTCASAKQPRMTSCCFGAKAACATWRCCSPDARGSQPCGGGSGDHHRLQLRRPWWHPHPRRHHHLRSETRSRWPGRSAAAGGARCAWRTTGTARHRPHYPRRRSSAGRERT